MFVEALEVMDSLPARPAHPAGWLSELCTRLEAGSPAHAAAAQIPLDWQPPVAPVAAVAATVTVTPVAGLEDVQARHPSSFAAAKRCLDALGAQPVNRSAWVDELCTRIEAGSPAEAAASHIALSWPN